MKNQTKVILKYQATHHPSLTLSAVITLHLYIIILIIPPYNLTVN